MSDKPSRLVPNLEALESLRASMLVMEEQLRPLGNMFQTLDSLVSPDLRRIADASKAFRSAFEESPIFAQIKAAQAMAAGFITQLEGSPLFAQIKAAQALADRFSPQLELYNKTLAIDDALEPWLKAARDFDHLGNAVLNRLQLDLRTWNRLSEMEGLGVLAKSATGWSTGATSILNGAAHASLSDSLVYRMLGPATALTRLGEKTALRLTHTDDATERERLEASVRVVEAQVEGHLTEVGKALETLDDVEDDGHRPSRRLTLATREQVEMLGAPASVSADNLASAAPSAEINASARRVLTLVWQVNREAQTRGRTEIFKPTTRFMEVFTSLPWMAVAGEKSFGDFVDDLYFLLYEGAGKDNLRFLRAHGGPLDLPEIEIVFAVKFLRNKWLRHDPEHGDPSGIRRSYSSFRETLQQLGFDRVPRSAEEFRRLQLRLLVEVTAFLERLLAGI